MNNKILRTIATAIITLIILLPVIAVTPPLQATPESRMTVNGVLSTDTYLLYPYSSKDLIIGFSKYGELIDEVSNIGLLYDPDNPFDPFANDLVEKYLWQEGWLLNITYRHRTAGLRRVWAAALFSDLVQWGGDWLRVTSDTNLDKYITPADSPHGGRKTTGAARTEDIQVLYNGPRRFVALLNTTIYDIVDSTQIPLARLLITVDFNKVKKYVTLIKDIKFIIDDKLIMGTVNATFSERGQWDMGKEILPKHIKAYAHFYTNNGTSPDEALPTCYGRDFHVNKSIVEHRFALAQIISEYWPYVGFAAFWPHPDAWTVDGWDVWDRSIFPLNIRENDMKSPPTPAEPDVPYVIGEWAFTSEYPHYRVVTVYGVTDLHDAEDKNEGMDRDKDGVIEDQVDTEVGYLLDEVFSPYDLNDAVHKNTARLVRFTTATSYRINNFVYVSDEEWDDYCSFAERVILLTEPSRLLVRGINYTCNPSGIFGLPTGLKKILYSSVSQPAYEWIVVGRESRAVDSAGAAMVSEAFDSLKNIAVKYAGLDMQDTVFGPSVPWIMAKFGAGTSRDAYYYLDGSNRAALRDDHCKEIAISSSNIISVGGPFANLVTEYFAEFTPALGWSQFPVMGRVDTLLAVSCWSKNTYKDAGKIGYAVISVYKDLNGTIGLLIYGWTGQDTYWASTALFEPEIVTYNKVLDEPIEENENDNKQPLPLIEYLQGINDCVTAIVIKFDYSTCIPSGEIVEMLGTISEKMPHSDP